MILGETFPEGGGFLDKVGVIAGLRPKERSLQEPEIPDAGCAAIAFDLIGMDGQYLGHRQMIIHSASFL